MQFKRAIELLRQNRKRVDFDVSQRYRYRPKITKNLKYYHGEKNAAI